MSETVSFGYEEIDAADKTARVGEVFSNVAAKYDIMNDAMSGGMHRLWKDRFVRRVKPQPGEAILDMAGGTGDIAFRMAARGASVTVSDINQDMLDVGIERAMERGIDGLVWSRQNAEELAFLEPDLRCLHDRLRHPQRDACRQGAERGASGAEVRRALLLPRILDRRMARLQGGLRSLFAPARAAASARLSPTTRTAIAISSNRSAGFPTCPNSKR